MKRSLWVFVVVTLAALATLITLLPSTASAQPGKENMEPNRQFITQAFEQWSKGGHSFFQDVFAPDVVWTIKGSSPVAGSYRSRQDFLDRAVKPLADRMATPVRPIANQVWADGDHVIVQWDGVGTAADGKPYSNSYVWIFRMVDQRAVEVIAFLDLVPYDAVLSRIPDPRTGDARAIFSIYAGMWITGDGSVRHELLPNGRYDEARGSRSSAYRGRYEVRGNRIDYWDDTGFTADGTFVSNDELHHGGMVFYRRK